MATVLLTAVSCRELPSHDEDGPSAYIDILALGDSYTAGNAATDGGGDDGYFFQSPDDPRAAADVRQRGNWHPASKDCFRNHHAYSEMLFQLLSSSGAHLNGACSGDTTHEITNTNGSNGQLNGFTAGQRAEVDLVTLSIGGNDLRFAEVVDSCFGPLRLEISCDQSLDRADAKLEDDTLYNDMKTALQYVSAQLPSARIVLVGYPLFWEGPMQLGTVDATARLKSGLDELNFQQQQLVTELNGSDPGTFAFLPLHNFGGTAFFDGHGIGGNKDLWIQDLLSTVYAEEWAHPTAEGHAAIASALNNMPFVQQLLDDSITRDYPKMSLSKADDQWYALDGNGVLWKVTADFVKCQLPNGPYKLVSWKNSQQLFTAATNSSPYLNLPGQPGCNLTVPREGDILQHGGDVSGPRYWRVSFGPNGEEQRTEINRNGTLWCMQQRGARIFGQPAVDPSTYQELGGLHDETPECGESYIIIEDIYQRLWVVAVWDGGATNRGTIVHEDWVDTCLRQGPFQILFTNQNLWTNPPLVDELDYSGYTDARCVS